ncbi:uncharacterized protein Dwil_GK25514 [Drosophila willistoni]|uniref:Uncharacterized protein n=1 Tax=Drosophila willistoni TaxID=7260 RepID=B4NDU4_DROWI|nr:uncharacterized protein LOC6649213 isoform X1 [Drosophila willistoni]EDW81913.2 uncharacterized protein Dwil_GK25514 [Drosophila willistoni]
MCDSLEQYHAIRPQGFDIEYFRLIIGQSYNADKCGFIYETDNIIELINGFDEMMNKEDIDFGAESLASIHVAGIMVYMLYHNDLSDTEVRRTIFLQRCFDYMACTEETHIHELCAEILCLLDLNHPGSILNVIICCRHACVLSTMAQIVSTCLLWSMLDRLTDLGLDAHRLRPYPELMVAIAIVNPSVYLQSYLHALNLIVRLIAALLAVGPCGSTERLCQEVGVSKEIFKLSEDDAIDIFRWLNAILTELRVDMHLLKDAQTDERLVVLELTCELMQQLHQHLDPETKSLDVDKNQSLDRIQEYCDKKPDRVGNDNWQWF